jgi:hypothetical protein
MGLNFYDALHSIIINPGLYAGMTGLPHQRVSRCFITCHEKPVLRNR